jgi:putative phosphoesterase
VRVAALYDIHGNLPALEAVLREVSADLVVVGGDVAPGPDVDGCLERLSALDVPVRWVMGNGDREVLEGAEFGAWNAARLTPSHRELMSRFEPAVEVVVDGLGPVLFCHGSPRSDTEMITQITPPQRLRPMLKGVAADVVVCGHTHHQFDVVVDGTRVINAGSVGLPYQGDAAAFWLSLGPGVEFRETAYDARAAVDLWRATEIPDMEDSVVASLVEPISAQQIAQQFELRATSPQGER